MRDLVKMSDIIRIYNNYDCDKAREEVMKLPSIDMVGEFEKIKSEIQKENNYNPEINQTEYLCGSNQAYKNAISIIDNHIKELKGEE